MAVSNSVGMFNENAGATYHARDFRREADKMLMGWDVRAAGGSATTGLNNGGVPRSGDCAVAQRGAGANMSVDVAAGGAMVGGTESATQGEYFVFNDATLNVVISASDPSNPRIDVIGVQIRDKEYSGATDDARILVVTGTPAASPAVPTLPADFLSLAHVAVAAGATSIITANITDKRSRVVANGGVIPCTNTTTFPATALWSGMVALDLLAGLAYRYDGAAWRLFGQQTCAFANFSTTTITLTVPTILNGYALKVLSKAQHASGTGVQLLLRFNADATASYVHQYILGSGTSALAALTTGASGILVSILGNESANRFSMADIDIPDYASAVHKQVVAKFFSPGDIAGAQTIAATVGGNWANTAAITSVLLVAASGNMATGSKASLQVVGSI